MVPTESDIQATHPLVEAYLSVSPPVLIDWQMFPLKRFMPFRGSMVLTFGTEYSIFTSPSNAEVISPRQQLCICSGSSTSPEMVKYGPL